MNATGEVKAKHYSTWRKEILLLAVRRLHESQAAAEEGRKHILGRAQKRTEVARGICEGKHMEKNKNT